MKNKARRSCMKITSLLLAAVLIFASFIMLPGKAYAAGSSDVQVGDFIDAGRTDAPGYTGVPHWRVLDKKDDGSMLLMSEYLWRGNGEDNADAGICFNSTTGSGGFTKDINGQVFHWRGSAAETWCDNFWEAVLKDSEELTIVPTTLSDKAYKYIRTNGEIYFAKADAVLYENKVFFLSAEELAGYEDEPGYIADPVQRKGHLPNGGSPEQWLLRSTQNDTNWASEVKADGEIAAVTANTRRAARPVFWAKFTDGTSFISTTDESGKKTWVAGEDQTDPSSNDQTDPSGSNKDSNAQKAAEEKAKAIKSVVITGSKVTASSVKAAVAEAGGRNEYVTEIVLGKGVKKINKRAFAGTNVRTLVVKSKKLRKKSVKGSLKGSKVTTIRVKVGKAKDNRKYVRKYKKIFTKKNAGRKVKVRK